MADDDGTDIAYFELLPPYDHDNDGDTPEQLLLQVRVKPIDVVGNEVTEDRPMIVFNHEDEDANEYTVKLTAIDATGDRMLDATLTVNIVVTNRNEAPSVPKAAPEGLRIAGDASVSYAEDETDAVATYEIAGPGADEATATWSLTGDDRSDFNIGRSDGMLTFEATPDFENPGDNGGDNTYEITVDAAIAGGDPLSLDVTVTVTNVDDPGTVRLSPTAPRVDAPITASVTDPDGGVTGETWRWASSDAMGGPYTNIPGATSDGYTPVAGDEGNYLRATASYTDRQGSRKSAEMVSANAVVAATAAPTTGSEVGDTYDTNPKDGEIGGPEVIQAVRDYFANNITGSQVIEVVRLYFGSR